MNRFYEARLIRPGTTYTDARGRFRLVREAFDRYVNRPLDIPLVASLQAHGEDAVRIGSVTRVRLADDGWVVADLELDEKVADALERQGGGIGVGTAVSMGLDSDPDALIDGVHIVGRTMEWRELSVVSRGRVEGAEIVGERSPTLASDEVLHERRSRLADDHVLVRSQAETHEIMRRGGVVNGWHSIIENGHEMYYPLA